MPQLPDAERRAIEADCARLALISLGLNDAQDYAALAALFTPDASFARPTDPANPIAGRAAIEAAFKARPKNRITRHICSNLVIEAQSTERALGRMYVTLYTADSANAAAHGVLADGKVFIGEFLDEYVNTAQGWRIDKRRGRITLTVE